MKVRPCPNCDKNTPDSIELCIHCNYHFFNTSLGPIQLTFNDGNEAEFWMAAYLRILSSPALGSPPRWQLNKFAEAGADEAVIALRKRIDGTITNRTGQGATTIP